MLHASIIGGSGYSGAELLKILLRRDDIKVRQITAQSSAGCEITELYPEFSGQIDKRYVPLDNLTTGDIDVLFVALPSGEAKEIIPQYLDDDVYIIDLGGDLRLPSETLYEKYYGMPHNYPRLLESSVYGLPELNRPAIRNSSLIANPGCYPTSVILSLYPLLKENAIEPDGIVINSLSGVSGAGRKASVALNFTEVNENIKAYKITKHQHIPEIKSVLERATGGNISFSFVPHLIPITRGIYTTIHANLNGPADNEKLKTIYKEYYNGEPFIRLVNGIPAVKQVTGTNYCDIFVEIQEDTGQVIIISVIDNLLKGAAGQAVQNMNIMFNLQETKGLV